MTIFTGRFGQSSARAAGVARNVKAVATVAAKLNILYEIMLAVLSAALVCVNKLYGDNAKPAMPKSFCIGVRLQSNQSTTSAMRDVGAGSFADKLTGILPLRAILL
jgi:hypothetical protein